MTHVKNVEAFSRLVGFCTGYGGHYNPGRQNLQVESLTASLTVAQETLRDTIQAKAHYDNVVNSRKQVFETLPKLASSVIRLMEASGAKRETIADALGFFRHLTGRSPKAAKPPVTAATEPKPTRRSLQQQAYVSKADWFAKLVQVVKMEPLYVANEEPLTKAALEQKVKELYKLNRQVANARVAWSNALVARNKVLYDAPLSLYEMTQAVKKYLRGIFGLNSQQYAQVKALRFTKSIKR
jgi:hypothetical protein